jgi:hypothetical protein
MEVRILQRFGIGRQVSLMAYPIAFKNRRTKESGNYRPTANQCGALQCCSIVARRNFNCSFDKEIGKKTCPLLKSFKRVLVREWSADCLSVCLRTHHQSDYLVNAVCSLAAQPDQKSADLKACVCGGSKNPY